MRNDDTRLQAQRNHLSVAALNVLDGTVIGTCYPRHRNEEFLKFLRKIDRETPQGLPLHLILDNYGHTSTPM